MKSIAILVPDFMVEHCRDFIKGIIEYFKNKNVMLYIANTQRSFESSGMFEYQYWNSFELLKSKQIDAYIVAAGVYTSALTYDTVKKYIQELGNVPVVADSVEFDLPNVYSVVTDSEKSYQEIIKHLKTEHGCKKIAFMSANNTKSQEALERFEAFKKALSDNRMEFDESLVFEGYFTDFVAKDVILNYCKTHEKIEFDAIVAANDLMATGCIRAFDEMGINVPGDIKVIGFDDAIFASLSYPRLSTISQNIVRKGERCGEIVEALLNGENVEKITKTPLYPVYRQSCGCISLSNSEMVYKDSRGNVFSESSMKSDLLQLYQNEAMDKYKFSSLLDIVNVTNTLRQFYYTMNLVTKVMEITAMAVCLFDEPVYVSKRTGFTIPDKAELYMYYNDWTKASSFRPGIFFNPHEEICPSYKIEDYNLPIIVYPIFAGEKFYGYLVCNVYKSNFTAYTFNLKILISFIANTIEYTNRIMQTEKLSKENTKLLDNNSDLTLIAKTDELTGLLNRRGFMEIGQRTIDLIQEMDLAGVVFFADLDGLKMINDNYGHEMGDKALKLQAKVFKNVFRKTDVIGRLSGDEFAMIGNGMTIESVNDIKEKILEENKKISKKEKLPFELSVSIGAVNLESSSMLAKLLSEADKVLYEEKRIKHAAK